MIVSYYLDGVYLAKVEGETIVECKNNFKYTFYWYSPYGKMEINGQKINIRRKLSPITDGVGRIDFYTVSQDEVDSYKKAFMDTSAQIP